MKFCKICKQEKENETFRKNSARCKKCEYATRKKTYPLSTTKAYVNAHRRKYVALHKEQVYTNSKNYYNKNKDKSKAYYQTNKTKIKARARFKYKCKRLEKKLNPILISRLNI